MFRLKSDLKILSEQGNHTNPHHKNITTPSIGSVVRDSQNRPPERTSQSQLYDFPENINRPTFNSNLGTYTI